jgi:predicted ATPase
MELPIRRAQRTDAVFLEFRTAHGQVMAPESVSDGVMLSLASLAIAYQPDPPKTLLMEEPDKGVHHGSLRETITTLKQLSEEKGVQVILTTHSPYLLDEVEPERVHVFTKDGEGAVHAKRLSEFEDVDGMKKDFMTGEIWSILSKAHGI